MSKKDYNQFATLIGRYPELPESFIRDFTAILSDDNDNFDTARFYQWIGEVQAGIRDKETGKKIA